MAPDSPYRHRAWRKVRLAVLERDGYRCQIEGETCTGVADQVDHIVPWLAGGAWLDPSNLRAACGKCNRARARGTYLSGWQRADTRIVLVVGDPPEDLGFGWGDVVVDVEALADALSVAEPRGAERHPAVLRAARAAFDAVVHEMKHGALEAERVFVVSSDPGAEDVFPHHEVLGGGVVGSRW